MTTILDQCCSANIPFFFKQWGGVQKKRNGRVLRGRTYNDMPARSRVAVAHAEERCFLRDRFDAIAQAFTAEPIPLRPIRKTHILEEAAL